MDPLVLHTAHPFLDFTGKASFLPCRGLDVQHIFRIFICQVKSESKSEREGKQGRTNWYNRVRPNSWNTPDTGHRNVVLKIIQCCDTGTPSQDRTHNHCYHRNQNSNFALCMYWQSINENLDPDMAILKQDPWSTEKRYPNQ